MKKLISIGIVFLLGMTLVTAGKVMYPMGLSGSSGSMYPTIKSGDIFKVSTIDSIQEGNIYCYRPDYRNFYTSAYYYICHRLIDIEDGLYYFQGDNNNYVDPPIEKKYIALEVHLEV